MPTLTELQRRRALYAEAEAKILQGQEYSISDGVVQRRLRRADLAEVRDQLEKLDAQIEALTPANQGGARRVYYGVPRR